MRLAPFAVLLSVPLVLAAAGCTGNLLGDVLETVVHDPLSRAGTSDVSGEVRGVDVRRQRLEVRGRDRTVRAHYDGRTRVIRDGRQYGINGLRRGDQVTMRVERYRGGLYARTIHVRGAYGRGSAHGGVAEGRVGRVWRDRAMFELRTRQGSVIVVPHPRTSRRDIDRVRRLRSGQHVQVEGRQIDRDYYEMRRLR